MASGAFLTFYPIMRIIGEQFRVGDTPQNILGFNVSLGVIYSILTIIPGLGFWIYWIKRDRRFPWKQVPSLESRAASPGSPPASV